MRKIGLLLTILGLTGCAGVHVSPGEGGKGIRYYQNSPYLLVYTDNNGGLKTELIYLPDATKIASVYPYSIFATNSTTFEFENGALKSGEAEADTGVIPRAVIAALEKVATSSIAAALREPEEGKPHVVPAPRLFKIEWDEKTKQAYLVGRDGRIAAGIQTDVNVKGKPRTVEPSAPPPPPNPPANPPIPVKEQSAQPNGGIR